MRSSIDYQDFALRLAGDGRGGYLARIERSPHGGGSIEFDLPFDRETWQEMFLGLEERVRLSRSDDRGKRHVVLAPAAPGPTAEEIGDALFRALFTGPVRDRFLQSLAALTERPEHGLRLRLIFDPEEPEGAFLASLPWELLYRAETRTFFARETATPVVRYLDVPRPPDPPPTGGPLRLLLVAACPPGSAPLDLEAETAQLEAAWGQDSSIVTELVSDATLDDLRRRLEGRRFHGIHFMGHGTFDEESGEGALLFQTATGGQEAVSGRLLAEILARAALPRFVFLSSCHTARLPRRDGLDSYTGAATALVMGGVPAVLAMQFPISDRAALAFSGAFYRALAAGHPADAAAAEGRFAVYRREPRSLEWITPVLFLRQADGRLFPLVAEPAEASGEEERATAGGAPPPVAGPPAARRSRRRWLASIAAILAAGLVALPLAKDAGLLHFLGPGWAPNPPGCPSPPGLELPLVRIEPGVLALPAEPGEEEERRLVVERPFCLGVTEVTQAQWKEVMGEEENLSAFVDDDRPVERVSWEDAQEFLGRLNARLATDSFRLPTETEWEYAARAGATTAYSFGDDPAQLAEHGNCLSDESEETGDGHDRTAPAASFRANAFGLYDLHGNVWEWVAGAVEPEEGEEPGVRRIRRGGAHDSHVDNCTAESRKVSGPGDRRLSFGFRVAREVEAPTGE